MADTTTVLNPGSGGDSMDESLVTQTDGVTQAKRPRVVIAGDAGAVAGVNDTVQPVGVDPGANPTALPVMPIALVSETPQAYVEGETRPLSLTPEGRLRTTATQANTYLDFFGDTSPLDSDPYESFHPSPRNEPWGI